MEKLTKRLDGTIPLKPNQKPCEIFSEFQHKKKDDYEVILKGDGSAGILGELRIYDKEIGISVVNNLINLFDLKKEELDL